MTRPLDHTELQDVMDYCVRHVGTGAVVTILQHDAATHEDSVNTFKYEIEFVREEDSFKVRGW
jgi:hypothetical protein